MHGKFAKSAYRLLGLYGAVGFLCRRCFRTDWRKVVFSSFWGRGFADNPKYVALELLRRRRDLDLVWLAGDQSAVRGQLPDGIRVGPYRGWGGIRESATAAVRVDNQLINLHTLGYAKRSDQLYVQTWHGSLGIKRIGFDFAEGTSDHDRRFENRRLDGAMVDALISNSSFESEIYRAQWFGGGRICEFGHPRNDILVNGISSDVAADIRGRLGVSTKERILLYAPTFRGRVAKATTPRVLIPEFMKYELGDEYVLLCKHHPLVRRRPVISEYCSDFAMDVTDTMTIEDLLCVADICISDYSSLVFEASLLHIPMIFYAFDLEHYIDERDFYFDFKQYVPGKIVYSLDELIQAVNREDYCKERIAPFADMFFDHRDGRATDRVVKLLYDNLK